MQKDFLDLYPHDALSEGTFWKTEADANMALTGCYKTLYNSYFMMDLYPIWDSFSDNSWDYNNALGAKSAMTAPINSSIGGMVTGFYSNTYARIATCNYFLDNIDQVQASADKINAWKGEVLFLRAFYYFHLSEFYGESRYYSNLFR